jgi:hypothetical protein
MSPKLPYRGSFVPLVDGIDKEVASLLDGDGYQEPSGEHERNAALIGKIMRHNARAHLLEPNPMRERVEPASITFEATLESDETMTLTQTCPWTFRACQARQDFPWGVLLVEHPEDLFILDLRLGAEEVFCDDVLPLHAFLFEGVAWGKPKRLTGRPGTSELMMSTVLPGTVVTFKIRNKGSRRELFAQIHGVRLVRP